VPILTPSPTSNPKGQDFVIKPSIPYFKCPECRKYWNNPQALKKHYAQHEEITKTDKKQVYAICNILDDSIKRGILCY